MSGQGEMSATPWAAVMRGAARPRASVDVSELAAVAAATLLAYVQLDSEDQAAALQAAQGHETLIDELSTRLWRSHPHP